jgi:hypothetical protein
MICKIYGIIDITAALIIFFGLNIPDILKTIILLVMLFKGIPSLFAH